MPALAEKSEKVARVDPNAPWPLARLAHLDESTLLEALAFAEGRLLSVHPFLDFNGRVTRLWLRELLRRLDLPPVDLVPVTPADEPAYFAALRAGDALDWQPLATIWRQRLESFRP